MHPTSRRTWPLNTVLGLALTGLIPTFLAGPASGTTPVPDTMTSSVPDCGAPVTKASGEPWTCTFVDEFGGTSLDRTKWSPMSSDGTGTGFPECRVDSPNNIAVSDGVLKLTVRKEKQPFVCDNLTAAYVTQYTAGAVTTYQNFVQEYGRFDVRAKFPASKTSGLHSAIWMWPRDKTYADGSGEIDIAEFRTGSPTIVVPTLHYKQEQDGQPTSNYKCVVNRPEDFHTYSLVWTADMIQVSYDGKLCLQNVRWKALGLPRPEPFNLRYAINLNQSMGAMANFNPLLAPLPATMQVDYVKVWQ